MINPKKSILTLALFASLSNFAVAESQSGPNLGEKGAETAQSKAVATLLLADQLARYGIENADAVAIIQAAKLKLSVATRDEAVEKTSESQGESGTKAEKKGDGIDLSAAALLGRAEGMAAGNATLTALITDARSSKSRGGISGPVIHNDKVSAKTRECENKRLVQL